MSVESAVTNCNLLFPMKKKNVEIADSNAIVPSEYRKTFAQNLVNVRLENDINLAALNSRDNETGRFRQILTREFQDAFAIVHVLITSKNTAWDTKTGTRSKWLFSFDSHHCECVATLLLNELSKAHFLHLFSDHKTKQHYINMSGYVIVHEKLTRRVGSNLFRKRWQDIKRRTKVKTSQGKHMLMGIKEYSVTQLFPVVLWLTIAVWLSELTIWPGVIPPRTIYRFY